MLESEKREILDALKTGRDALREALAGVDDPLAARKPGGGGWSILECVEHLAAAEQSLASRLSSATESHCSQANPTREARIAAVGADRSRPIEAPERARPGGRFGSLSEALAAFDGARNKTVQFVEGFNGDPRFWVTHHPLMAEPVNCYEMLLMISLHPVRHAKQISEIRAALISPTPQG